MKKGLIIALIVTILLLGLFFFFRDWRQVNEPSFEAQEAALGTEQEDDMGKRQ